MLLTAASLLGLVASMVPAPSSVYFEQTVVSWIEARPAGPGVSSRVWHGGAGRMRMETGGIEGGPALVLRLDEAKAWRLDPTRKTAVALDVERLRERSRMDLGVAGQLMGALDEPRVSELGEGRLIAGHRCRGYRL
jgi:hypothetical protein